MYPTIACVVCKNGNHESNTIAQFAMKSSELSIKGFYCIFVRTKMNLIAFLGPSNCVNTQYAALSGAMFHSVFDAINFGCSIIYFEGTQIKISKRLSIKL